ncbi:MAG: DNA-3-methyladenine glycosylase family protein [Candidatus Thorarchaeota archaeon]|jgi:3-methyladenine DNA glycosylase/8-oxoguanine DNA glycosylase
MKASIDAPKGYDLLGSVHSWIYPDIQPVPEKTWESKFGRVFSFNRRKAAITIEQQKPGDILQVTWNNESVSETEVQRKMQGTLGLHVDTGPAIKAMMSDPAISRFGPTVSGIRPYSADNPFEALIKAIIQQQVSYIAANRFTQRLVLGTTRPIFLDGVDLFMFPDSHTLSNLTLDQLRSFGVGYKARYLSEISSQVSEGKLNLGSLEGKRASHVKEALAPVRGVGTWTIELLMISGLGDYSQFPYGDLVIGKILGKLYKDGEKMSRAEVRAQSDSWGTEGPMVLYLLMSAEVLGYLNDQSQAEDS